MSKNYMTVTSPIYRPAVDRSSILYIEPVDLYTADLSILYPVFVDLPSVYLPSYFLVSAYCLPVYRRPVNYLLNMSICLLPMCLPSVFLFLCICQLTECLPPTSPLSYNQYAVFVQRRPVYRLPFFLFLCICLPVYHRPVHLCSLTTCLLLTCLSYTQYLSTAVLPTCLSSTCLHIPWFLPTAYLSTADLPTHLLLIIQYLFTADVSTVYQSSFSFVSAN